MAKAKTKAVAKAKVTVSVTKSEKKLLPALLLCAILGALGVHRFYAGRIATGILWFCTGGIGGLGILVDFILLVSGNFKDGDGRLLTEWTGDMTEAERKLKHNKMDSTTLFLIGASCFLIPFLGLIIWAATFYDRPDAAKTAARWAIVGVIAWILAAILIAVLMFFGIIFAGAHAAY